MSTTTTTDARPKVPFSLQAAMAVVPMLMIGVGVITPVIANIQEAFPEQSLTNIYLVQTLPNLLMIPAALLAGVIAGRKMSYRALTLVAIAIYVIGGLMPFFLSGSFAVLLISRCIFGIGSGLIYPLGQALVYEFVKDPKARPRILANNSLLMNLGGVFFQYSSGFLALIAWNYVFLAYLLGIVSFVCVLAWLKKPENTLTPEVEEKTDEPKLSVAESFSRIPWFVYMLIIFYGASVILTTPVTMLVSTYIADYDLGDSSTAATCLIMYTIAGLLMGLVYPAIFRVFKRFSIGFGLLIEGIALFLMYFGGSALTIGAGNFLAGCGLGIFMPTLQQEIAWFCPRGADNTASGLMMCFMNVGMFLGGYWAAWACGIIGSDNIYTAWLCSGVLLVVLAAIAVISHLKDRPEYHLADKDAKALPVDEKNMEMLA